MKQKQFSIKAEHGIIDGFYYKSEQQGDKIAIIVNGLNGFSTYGMFPQMQKELALKGISSIAFNFSHGGVRGDNDYFTEIDLYEKNSMRLEVLDILSLVDHLSRLDISYKELYIITHSLGSIPGAFAAAELFKNNIPIRGIVFIAPSMNLDFWGEEKMNLWEKNGKLDYENKRTNQVLTLGREFLEETKKSATTWNLETPISNTPINYLIVHGDKDESIPIEEAYAVNNWILEHNNQCQLEIIKNASHTFNISHPYSKSNPEFETLISIITNWISNQ